MVSERHLEELLTELGLSADEGTKEDIQGYADRLGELVEDWDDATSRPRTVGVWSDDEYHALLDVYDEPRRRASEGPLADLSVVVKDNIAVEGLRMTWGAASFEMVPEEDATVVERLLDAGARLVGKSNMDAFAFGPGGLWSERGRVRNPLDPDRIPGGSSSGSGVAVAAGLVDAALGSDTGGSVRSPAACCGIVGIKPSYGLVSRYGLLENVPSTDVIGPLARDVETAARVLVAICGPDPRDPVTVGAESPPLNRALDRFEGLRIGALELTPHGISETVTDAMAFLAATLDEMPDVSIETFELDMTAVEEAYSVISGTEFVWLIRQSFAHRGGVPNQPPLTLNPDDGPFNEHIAERVLPGACLDAATDGHAYALAREQVAAFERELDALFESFDVLLTPTLRSLPQTSDELEIEGGFSYTVAKQFSLAGVPAVSVPFADRDGLPVSAQVLAPRFEDLTAIRAARLIERRSEWRLPTA